MTNYEKPDFWSQKAQKENYPARSVYKLKEIDEKFNFFKSSFRQGVFKILDLGAAPGSWSLYVLRHYGNNRRRQCSLFLAAADLLPLSSYSEFDNTNEFLFIQGDFTNINVREELVQNGPYNAIISDAAPPTTGSRTVDTMRSFSLAEEVLSFAGGCLIAGGNLAVKIFQGGEEASLLKLIRKNFKNAKSFKPAVCRSTSFETYYIGLGKYEQTGVP